ncbi:MAG: DnaJ family domain-containing protein [Pseudomonadota bacterium]
MIPGFEAIVEERIKKAQKEGQFDNLDGLYKPLKFEEYHGPEELRLAHKILKNSGFLPPEIELRKKISTTEQMLKIVQNDSPQKDKIQKRLVYLLTKLDTMRQGRSGFSLLNQPYSKAIEKKLS